MTDLHAAVGIPQLEKLDQLTAARQANAKRLSEGLAGTPGLDIPQVLPGREHVWHQYTVLVGPHAMLSRDELAAALTERGIGNGIYYPKIVFDYDCYRGHPLIPGADVSDFPVASAVAAQALSLPVHPHLTDGQLDKIIETVREVLGA
jgi:dTDP-4-amino-4,6-dideoxygalactose transaminase